MRSTTRSLVLAAAILMAASSLPSAPSPITAVAPETLQLQLVGVPDADRIPQFVSSPGDTKIPQLV